MTTYKPEAYRLFSIKADSALVFCNSLLNAEEKKSSSFIILLTEDVGSTSASVDFTIGDGNANSGLLTVLVGCICIFKRIKGLHLRATTTWIHYPTEVPQWCQKTWCLSSFADKSNNKTKWSFQVGIGQYLQNQIPETERKSWRCYLGLNARKSKPGSWRTANSAQWYSKNFSKHLNVLKQLSTSNRTKNISSTLEQINVYFIAIIRRLLHPRLILCEAYMTALPLI